MRLALHSTVVVSVVVSVANSIWPLGVGDNFCSAFDSRRVNRHNLDAHERWHQAAVALKLDLLSPQYY